MAIREPLVGRAAGSPGGPSAIREPLARPVTDPVVEPTALALREPSTSEAQRLQAPWNETTRLRMELARAKADLVESEHQAQLREQSRQDLQDMLWQLKDSEQRLWALAKQANLREQNADRRTGDSWALAVEDFQHLLSFLHPERLQEDACALSRGEAADALPAVPSNCLETMTTEDRGYLQQSLKWSSAVVAEARQMYFSLFLKLRNAGCSTLLRLLSRLCARQCLQAFNLFRGPSETATPERSKASHGEGTMTTQTPMPMEDSWQSWRNWLRSAPNSAQKATEMCNGSEGTLQRVLAKAAHGVADNQLCKVLMHWHGYCFRRRRALHCLLHSLQHCEDRIRRRALQTFRLEASQRHWERHAAEASKDLEAQQRRVTRSRRYWSAHLLMRVERGNLTKIFRSWARHCQQIRDLSLKSQIQALARQRNAHQTMASSESNVLALVLSRSKAAEGQLICRFFRAWSHWRLRKLRSETMNKLKLAKSNSWWLPVTFQAWKLQLGTLRWLRRCADRWKGQTHSRLLRSWTSWRSLTLASEAQHRRVLEKQETKQAAKSLVSAWFSWTRFQRRTTRWHASFVRLLRAHRSHRKLILLQAALASWQQFTLRTSFGIKQSQLKGQLRRMERLQHLRRCFHAWTLKHWQLQRSRFATAYGLQLAQRQFLHCFLRQWRQCAKRARLAGGRMGWREQMIMQKIFLQFHFAAFRGRTMHQMGAKMLGMAIGKQQQRKCSDLLRRWKEKGSRGQHRHQVERLADKKPKEVLGLYLRAWYLQSHSSQRRRRRRLLFHDLPTEADLLRLRQSFSLWRCRCRLLRQWSGAGAGAKGDRRLIRLIRLMLRAWQKLLREKQRARVLVLWTCFKEWTAQVEQDQQMRHMHSSAATACAKVRQQALMLAAMAFWSQLAGQGRQTAVNMALIASRHQWLVAAVAASNRACLAGAWKTWVHGIKRANQAFHLQRFLLRRSVEALLRLAFRAFVWAAKDAFGKPRPRPKQTQLSVLGETLVLQHHGQLLRAAVAALRWNMTELKCHRLENQMQHLGLQQGAASDALKQHVRRTHSILQRQERRSSSEYVSSALHAWHQVVTTSRRRTKVFDILRRPVQKFGLLRSFSVWKARLLARSRARSLSTLQDRRVALGFLLRWSYAVRSLQQQKERQGFALGEGRQRDRMMLHRMLLYWRAVIAEVKKNCAFLQRSVVLAIGAYDPCDRRQVAVCWAFWRLYMRQNVKALALRLQRCRVRLQQYCRAWATFTREAWQQRREIRHMERKQELWAAKARRRGLHLSFWRWQLHLQSSKLLLKADSAVALKASLGLLIVFRFCWTSWALLSSHRCSLAEQGQQRKIQGARYLVSTLRRIIASHLTRLRETLIRRRSRCVQAHWWDFYCSWTSRRIQQDKLRAFCHAWHALVLKLAQKKHRSNSAMEALAFVDGVGRRSFSLRLLLRAWRAAKGRSSRRCSQVLPQRSATGMASLFQLWRLHVQQLHKARDTQQRSSQACAKWLKWHEGQLRKLFLLLCFCALRFDALSARARKAHKRLAQVWSDQLRQERLAEETRQQRAARRFEKDLSRLKACSFSDGKLQAMGLELPEPVARPEPAMPAMPAMAIAIEPVVRQQGASPPAKLAPKACAARSVVVLDRADRRLVDMLERRGAIEEALSLHTSRLVKDG